MIKAIETRYKNFRFRSRTEARWAIVFDQCGIDWGYEIEGFELASGRYLPDFQLKINRNGMEISAWVEVKGEDPNKLERQKLIELCEKTKCEGYFLVGQPAGCHIIKCEVNTPNCLRFWTKLPDEVFPHLFMHKEYLRTRDGNLVISYFYHAVDIASAARFEFGENP